jgi:FG-GAP-like repeat
VPGTLAAVCLCACSATPFPGNPQSTGIRDVPFVDTYNFDFPTGAKDRGSKGGDDKTADVRIYSAADLANLLSAANVSTVVSGGVITGFTLGGGAPVAGVTLQVRDFNGNILPDVFYNGLGGVPDFVATDGTADQGSFTIFNAPPGEVFLLASGGARGMVHVGAFDQAISVKPFGVIPVSVAQIGVTGPITDWITGINVFPVELSAIGLQHDSRFSDDRGLLQLSPLVGFRVILPSNSLFTAKMAASEYLTTYEGLSTSLADLGSAVDLTRFLKMVSQSQADAWYQQEGLTHQPGTGVVVGLFIGDQNTPRNDVRYGLYDEDGQPAGQWFLGDDTLYRQGEAGWQNQHSFVVLNAPPGPLFLRASSRVESNGSFQPWVGANSINSYADGASIVGLQLAPSAVADNPFAPMITRVRGTVLQPDLVTSVSDVAIDVAGYPGGPGLTDGPIRSRTTFSGDEYTIRAADRRGTDPFDWVSSNLLVSSNYIFRVSDRPGQSRYVPTYQPVTTSNPDLLRNGTEEVVRNLVVYPRTEVEAMAAIAGVTLDPGAGILVGRVVDVNTASTVEGIQLGVFDIDGNSVGEMRYRDDEGLPQRLDSTSTQGEFVAFNVPPGVVLLHVVSKDDTGSNSARVFPGGVTTLGTMLVGDAPLEKVPVSGTVVDFQGKSLGGAELTFHGEPARTGAADFGFLTLFSDGTGAYDTTLGVIGSYIVKADAGTTYFPTYSFDVRTLLAPVKDQAIHGLGRAHAAQIVAAANAAGRSITVDPAKGIVVGEVNARGWGTAPGGSATITSGLKGPTAIAEALLNGDGIVDLIVANGDSDSVSVYFGTSTGKFVYAGTYPVGANPVDLVGTDVDGDGQGDILVLSQGATSGEVTVLLGTVRGVFREDPSRRLLVGNAPVGIGVGDMDGDGRRDDIVVLNGGGGSPTLSVFIRNDDRQYEPASYSGMLLTGTGPSRLLVQDVDPIADTGGQLNPRAPLGDVVVAMEGSDQVETYTNLGDRMVLSESLSLGSGSAPSDVRRVDINNDAVAGVSADLEYVVLNSGINTVDVVQVEGGVASGLAPPVALDPGCSGRAMDLVDTNGDGRLDLVVACSGLGTVTVYLGTGDGGFTKWQCDSACPHPALPVGAQPLALDNDLFDTEPGSDLAVANRFSDSMSIFYARPSPVEGIPITVTDDAGDVVPDVVYLDAAGNPIPGNATDASGRFVAFNVPPGEAWISATGGQNGNARVRVFPDSASFIKLSVLAASPPAVTLQGQVSDAVNAPQSDIEVTFAGTGIGTVSTDELTTTGVFELTLPSNQNNGVIRLRHE